MHEVTTEGRGPVTTTVTRDTRPYAFADKKNRSSIKHDWERARSGTFSTMRMRGKPGSGPDEVVSARHFPGDGSSSIADSETTPIAQPKEEKPHHTQLGQLPATAIAGNDITSSCLYSAGITLQNGGIMAPFSSAILCFVLWLFRDIYSEVCSGLPMNGGTYNALLNTMSKSLAALASVLSLVSYTATAVVSASSAAEYLNFQWPDCNVLGLTLGILIFFALLNIMGVSESANVATFLFILHLLTMTILIFACLIFVIRNEGVIMIASYHSTSLAANPYGNYALNLFNGYCAALLGVTGFESSSNYIEEQQPGVFPKTLRNMWIAVSILNPLLTVLSIGVVPIEEIVAQANYSLAAMGLVAAGQWLRYLIVIDATMVLSGAVLTSYVGVVGLLRRLAYDQLMPSFFLKINKCRGTNHWIVISFCLLTCSLRLLVNDMNTLGGVYAIAFLGVMALFTIANVAVKMKRAHLPRSPITPMPQVILAFICVMAGMIGNLLRSSRNAEYFLIYFFAFAFVVVASVLRIHFVRFLGSAIRRFSERASDYFREWVGEIRAQPVVFFTRAADIAGLNKMILYVLNNEDTNLIYVVHCAPDLEANATKELTKELEEACSTLDGIYPKMIIETVVVEGSFDPAMVNMLSEELGVSKNFMFITCPSDRFPHGISRFGGLRVISY